MLSLKRSTNTLSTNTKINLSNIQYAKNSNKIKFISYFNHQNHIKDKKIFFRFDIIYPTGIIRVSIFNTCRIQNTPNIEIKKNDF